MKKEKVERFCFSYEEVARVLATKLGLDESRRISLRDAGADTPALVLEVEREVEEVELAELDCPEHKWTPASLSEDGRWVEGFMCSRCGASTTRDPRSPRIVNLCGAHEWSMGIADGATGVPVYTCSKCGVEGRKVLGKLDPQPETEPT